MRQQNDIKYRCVCRLSTAELSPIYIRASLQVTTCRGLHSNLSTTSVSLWQVRWLSRLYIGIENFRYNVRHCQTYHSSCQTTVRHNFMALQQSFLSFSPAFNSLFQVMVHSASSLLNSPRKMKVPRWNLKHRYMLGKLRRNRGCNVNRALGTRSLHTAVKSLN